jgi:hypothetical protein
MLLACPEDSLSGVLDRILVFFLVPVESFQLVVGVPC